MFDLIIKHARCFFPHPNNPDEVVEEQSDIAIKDQKIQKIGRLYQAKTKKEFSAKGLYLLPGLIDTQVHFREPGMEHKEDIYHGSTAAIKGGITAYFEMPNTIPPTIQPADLQEKIRRAKKSSFCDFAFYLAASKQNKLDLNTIENRHACPGVKLFLGNSTGNLALEDDESLHSIFSTRRRITSVHAEDESRLIERKHLAYTKPLHAKNHPLWRDSKACLIATQRVVALAKKYNKAVHILHVSSKEEMHFLKDYRDVASIEVTPQHLSLQAPDCYEQLGSLAQMNPAIRDKTHQDALWQAVQQGLVDIIGSDHAAHTMDEKLKTYPDSPSGMPGVQTMLPLMLNHVNNNKLSLKHLVKLLAHNPVKRFKIKNQGMIKEGYRANLTLVDLKLKKQIESRWLASKCAWSPFVDWKIQGWPVFTFLHGKMVMGEGEVFDSPSGKEILFHDITPC